MPIDFVGGWKKAAEYLGERGDEFVKEGKPAIRKKPFFYFPHFPGKKQ